MTLINLSPPFDLAKLLSLSHFYPETKHSYPAHAFLSYLIIGDLCLKIMRRMPLGEVVGTGPVVQFGMNA